MAPPGRSCQLERCVSTPPAAWALLASTAGDQNKSSAALLTQLALRRGHRRVFLGLAGLQRRAIWTLEALKEQTGNGAARRLPARCRSRLPARCRQARPCRAKSALEQPINLEKPRLGPEWRLGYGPGRAYTAGARGCRPTRTSAGADGLGDSESRSRGASAALVPFGEACPCKIRGSRAKPFPRGDTIRVVAAPAHGTASPEQTFSRTLPRGHSSHPTRGLAPAPSPAAGKSSIPKAAEQDTKLYRVGHGRGP